MLICKLILVSTNFTTQAEIEGVAGADLRLAWLSAFIGLKPSQHLLTIADVPTCVSAYAFTLDPYAKLI